MKRTAIGLLACLAITGTLAAQAAPSLSPSSSLPVVDGTVGASEYQFNTVVSGMSLGVTLGSDGNVYLSTKVQTAGWVALGVGGLVMNGSRLFIAYDDGKKPFFTEQKGIGHTHVDASDSVVSKWAVKQSGGYTTLELVVPASAAVSKGVLNFLYSYNDSTNIGMHHKARGSMSLAVAGS